VAFLAGPTGVGKTELAKTITSLLFGDESAYIRFDMSEFSAEHADQRLIGAPPGYVGYDVGGELTNAIREKPFSVVLFDEIEKAHPRILDKFLQILDDGVLTSGRGDRVYFSEALIVFTSNLGIYRHGEQGERVANVLSGEPFEQVRSKVHSEIERHFKLVLNRPEILNRIGENIIVFDFIGVEVGAQIFESMIQPLSSARLPTAGHLVAIGEEALRLALRRLCIDRPLERWPRHPQPDRGPSRSTLSPARCSRRRGSPASGRSYSPSRTGGVTRCWRSPTHEGGPIAAALPCDDARTGPARGRVVPGLLDPLPRLRLRRYMG
jgi:ATP-dependent Clp protease ATP-binding subunit ClpA